MTGSAFIRPFRALHPTPEHAAAIIAPPYDVVSREEATALVAGRPNSFLRVSRPEVDFDADVDPHSDAVYERGAANFARLKSLGMLTRDPDDAYYVYGMRDGNHEQYGIVLTTSIAAYEAHRVRRHELTRPDKENDRVRNIESLNAQTGPVLTAFRCTDALRRLVDEARSEEAIVAAEGPGGVLHYIWRVDDAAQVAEYSAHLNAVDALYIADGHHRSAAAARVAAMRRPAGADADPDASYERFLSVAFPHDAMQILDYNRIVRDLNGLSAKALVAAIRRAFDVSPLTRATSPDRPARFSMYLEGHWYSLDPLAATAGGDPVATLDISILHGRLIEPILGVGDPRMDPRVDFVGGVRGLEELERRVDAGDWAVAFALYPTSMEQLMAVADAGKLMPPKSTWFEPKLADGLVSHVLD
jgi:uncharacterized protein (DUF1015 family)